MNRSQTEVLIKSYLNVRLHSCCELLAGHGLTAVITANLSIILTYIYIQGGMGGGPVLRGAWIPITVVKLHC
jgi:hypothetical protein